MHRVWETTGAGAAKSVRSKECFLARRCIRNVTNPGSGGFRGGQECFNRRRTRGEGPPAAQSCGERSCEELRRAR
ncbi:MAG: hypothetical protein AVDCRST_MAG88-531 [uncultured Thermomicrobiales bacterium]|uniref:Uncharacterized protein n=1 Tax=uncultured Thermomicrobiales bacterium TaxID=1645740 RepID=A0A6J4UDL3_9BACT|nr:MAG: hypothetical protein AVDCRST_MAG88-531 [uncultured Thermomicrobiales bacterium]